MPRRDKTRAKSPAFQFYAADWLADENVSMMSLEEEGAYIRLLAYCWREGSIPADIELLRRLCKGCSQAVASVVAQCFTLCTEDGTRLVHKRIEAEREKQREWSRKSSQGGLKSAKIKADKRVNGGSTTLPTLVEPNVNSSFASSSSLNTLALVSAGDGQKRKSARKARAEDARHTPVRQHLEAALRRAGIVFAWNVSAAGALGTLLRGMPDQPAGFVCGLVDSLMASDPRFHTEKLPQLIAGLLRFQRGPLDKHSQPMRATAPAVSSRRYAEDHDAA